MITISLNGDSREVPPNLSLESLLIWLNLPTDRVAVERNLEIVPRRLWTATTILPGDRLEVVHFVGGGHAQAPASASPRRTLFSTGFFSIPPFLRTHPV